MAEREGFRPCLRCRPELAPGFAPIDEGRTVAHAAALRIEAGAMTQGLDALAEEFHLSSRQLRRRIQAELGVTPVELAQTHRLLLAKRLITETSLPFTAIAFAAGFESVRRFNALFQSRYGLTPSALRRSKRNESTTNTISLSLAYRPPFDLDAMFEFLAGRAIPGVEAVIADCYLRTVRIDGHRGWLRVSATPNHHTLRIEISDSLIAVLPQILVRLRIQFDLDARPDVIARQFAEDPVLAASVKRRPGLRLPGAFDPFETCLRAILGQQVSVRGATTLAGRMAARFGEPVETPYSELCYLSPTPDSLAEAEVDAIAGIGMPGKRAETIRYLADAVARGKIRLQTGIEPTPLIERLQQIPGIGPWTSQYIAMRALHWPDAFPAGDLGLAKASGLRSVKELNVLAERWRPWRAYAAIHLWDSLRHAAITPGIPQ